MPEAKEMADELVLAAHTGDIERLRAMLEANSDATHTVRIRRTCASTASTFLTRIVPFLKCVDPLDGARCAVTPVFDGEALGYLK